MCLFKHIFKPITTAFRYVTTKRSASAIERGCIVGRAEIMLIKTIETSKGEWIGQIVFLLSRDVIIGGTYHNIMHYFVLSSGNHACKGVRIRTRQSVTVLGESMRAQDRYSKQVTRPMRSTFKTPNQMENAPPATGRT